MSKALYLLRETATVDANISLLESANSYGEVKILANLQDLNRVNRNGRLYGDIVKSSLDSPEISELKANRSWFGEFGHPLSPEIARQVTIDNKFISHEILSTSIEGDTIRGVICSIPTKHGEEFGNLIRRGTKVAFSLRAVGNVKKNSQGIMEVVNPFRVITYDCVILPSHKIAYQDSILSESAMISEGAIAQPYGHNLIIDDVQSLKESAIMYDIANLAMKKSDNVKAVREALEFDFTKISLTENNRAIVLTNTQGTELTIPLENYVSKMVTNILSEAFKK